MLKKIVMKRHILLIFTTLYFTVNGYSQACGGGTLTLSIYTLNGLNAKKISYEIFPASKEIVEKYSQNDIWISGKIINGFSENELIANENLNNELNKLLQTSKISKAGKITTTLKFKTMELGYFPIILKINIDNKTIYILGNHFGGCNREACVIWNGNYFRLI
jgi:hypothetical protein